MASNILANLKIKHAPKQKKAFSIKIQQPMPQTQPLQSFQSEILIPSEQLSTKQILQPAKSIVQIPVESKQPIKQSNITSKIFNKIGQFDIDRDSILNKIKMYKNFQGVSAINEEPIIEVKNQPLNVILEERETEKQTERREKEPTIKKSSRIIKIHKKLGRIILISSDEKNEKLIAPARKTHKPKPNIIEVPNELIIDDPEILKRLPEPKQQILLKASKYYMNNRQFFVNFITSLFNDYKSQLIKDKTTFSCENKDKSDTEFLLLSHQSIVRDYINLYTPYRGVLLYHGLGAGKTCSSIAIAEGIKSEKRVIIMTPASLRRNYVEELKKCGDLMYKKNQYWEFINTQTNADAVPILSSVLGLTTKYINDNNGAWLVNIKKKTNYDKLSSNRQILIDNQLNEMIKNKYTFINYNGLRKKKFDELTRNDTINPFDNAVIVVDEVHNLVSRIVNKIKKPDSLSIKLYNYIMKAQNAKVVFLSGTPIINYPNEIAILFNMIRGEIKTWTLKLKILSSDKITEEIIRGFFLKSKKFKYLFDYIKYKPTTTSLIITKNPFGFGSKYDDDTEKYKGVNLNEKNQISDDEFIKILVRTLKDNNIEVIPQEITIDTYKSMPDTLDEFLKYFINTDENTMKNTDLFKRRVLGLTSYFKDIEELMPSFNKDRDIHIVEINMSDFQFGVYEEARIKERAFEKQMSKKKKKNKNNNVFEETASTYRIFSRAFCNFVFPHPHIVRPMPKNGENIEDAIEGNIDEDMLDNVSVDEQIADPDGTYEADDKDKINADIETNIDETYEIRIKNALDELWTGRDTYLTPDALERYSPKFLHILEYIQDPENVGLHLIYSQFRSLEGIGILKLVLEANGFSQFKLIKNSSNNWDINIKDEDIDKPKFVLYTGTESPDEKEIIRNVFNSSWSNVPQNIVDKLKAMSNNNYLGEIIKVLMITSSGAEGISLKNVRFVHIVESYWHYVRIEQVIGRARRICSHVDLPIALRTVKVFLYLMTFSEKQLETDGSIELKLKDKSKITNTPISSDKFLYEIAILKNNIIQQILKSVKETAIDCNINASIDNPDNLQCYSFSGSNTNTFSYAPSIIEEQSDVVAMINKKEITWKPTIITIKGINYAMNKLTNEIYDLESINKKNPMLIGNIISYTDPKTGKTAYKLKFLN